MEPSNLTELELARLAISGYYTNSDADQLEAPKTQTELQAEAVNEDAAQDSIEGLEEVAAEHKETLNQRRRVKPSGKKSEA